jgi:type I restriction enzyme S subunit
MKYATYSKYKPSPMAWLDQLPTHWNAASLRWMSKRYAGGTPDKGNEAYWEDGDIPWINSGAVNDGYITQPSELITREGFANSSAKWIPKDALVMALAGQGKTKGMVAQLGIPTTCNQSMAALIPDHRFAPRYLYYWLTANYQNIRNLAGGEARDGLNLEMLGSIPCPVPPVDEQQTIARFLDAKTAQIDALVAQKRQLIDKLKEKRQALIARTVTRGLPPEAAKAAGLEPNPEMKDSGVEWLGQTPKDWTAKAVRYIFRNCDSRRIPLSSEERADLEKLYPYYGASGVIDMVDDYLFDEPLVLVAEDGANLLSRSTPLAFLASGKYWVNNHAHILKPLAGDIRYWVATLETFDFSPLITGAAQPKLTADRLGGIQLPVPPANEQTAIADYLASKTGELDALVGQAVEVVDRLTEYRQALITSAVTGKIDVRELA